jgi:hypothetical protein
LLHWLALWNIYFEGYYILYSMLIYFAEFVV